MKNNDFLEQEKQKMIKLFEKYGSIVPTFTIQYDDGTITSFATNFDGSLSKENFNYIMRKLCTDPKVIASVFVTEGWSSKIAEKENKRPSECADREEIVMMIFSSRNKDQEIQLYKLDQNRKLDFVISSDEYKGRFSNPFSYPCLSTSERKRLAKEFQGELLELLFKGYNECHYMGYLLFLLTDSSEPRTFWQLTEKEWCDKNWLKQMIRSRCQELQTLAFALVFPEDDKIKVIFESREDEKLHLCSIDPITDTMRLDSTEKYNGDFSGFLKEFEFSIVPGLKSPFLN
jgi:hypothetical protein